MATNATAQKKWTVLIVSVLLLGSLGVIGHHVGLFGQIEQVLEETFYPGQAAAKKYQWLHKTSNELELYAPKFQRATQELTSLISSYHGKPKENWEPEDLKARNLLEQEVLGLSRRYTELATKYNEVMEKSGFPFTTEATNTNTKVLRRQYPLTPEALAAP